MNKREEFLRLASRCNVIELMRICYAADAPVTPERLNRYLEALRANGTNRAVFASVILCYDPPAAATPKNSKSSSASPICFTHRLSAHSTWTSF